DAESVLALVGQKAETLVGLDRVVAFVLQRIRADLVGEADAATFLIQVEDEASTFGSDARHRRVQLRAAVAARRVKHVAGEARRVHARQHTVAVADLAEHERDVLLAVGEILERVDLEVAELRRQLRRGDLADERQAEGGPEASPDCLKDVQRLRLLAYS